MGSVILSEPIIHIQCGFACGQVEMEGSISCVWMMQGDKVFVCVCVKLKMVSMRFHKSALTATVVNFLMAI